ARAAASPVSARIRGFRASAATGSPGTGSHLATTQAAPIASAVAQPISTTAAAATTAVGVCGHACAVRPFRTSLANLMPNGSAVPLVTTAASLAAAQISPQTATSDQQPIRTTHPAALPP